MLILGLLFLLHWIGDFYFQSRWMATNKSSNILALTLHVATYSSVLLIGLLPFQIVTLHVLSMFILANFSLHLITDAVTSRYTKYFKEKEDIHSFFLVIGFDQLIHQISLMVTAYLILGAI